MTTESETKKPPAHEVIVDLLREFARIVEREARDASHNPEIAASHGEIVQYASVLTLVLTRMHVPEKDRPAIEDALRQLPREFFSPIGSRGLRAAANVLAKIEGDTRGV